MRNQSNPIWDELGFSQTPYRATELKIDAADFELFTGRKRQRAMFQSLVRQDNNFTIIISGEGGVGKTSFFNIEQYRLYAGKGEGGPYLLPSFEITSIHHADDTATVARRIVHNLVKSIIRACKDVNKKIARSDQASR